jgi:hypothetical protein
MEEAELETIQQICRGDPEKFFTLSWTDQISVLDAICGPSANYVFRGNFGKSTMTVNRFQFNRLQSRFYMLQDASDWKYLGRLMEFFGVMAYQIGPIHDKENLLQCMQTFEFGCFRKLDEPLREESRENAALEWCYGEIGVHLIAHAVTDGLLPEVLEMVISRMGQVSYMAEYIKIILERITPSQYQNRVNEEVRTRIITILSQQYLANGGTLMTLAPYAYLVPRVEHCFYKKKADYGIPKPRWSKTAHRMVAPPGFTHEVRTVIAMQKFRYSEFPLHKDLIELLIQKIFLCHLQGFEARVDYRDKLFDNLYASKDTDSVLKFCLGLGVYPNLRSTTGVLQVGFPIQILNAVHLSMEIALDWWDLRDVTTELQKAVVKAVHPNPPYIFSGADQIIYGNQIIAFCKEHRIGYYDLVKGNIILKQNGDGSFEIWDPIRQNGVKFQARMTPILN